MQNFVTQCSALFLINLFMFAPVTNADDENNNMVKREQKQLVLNNRPDIAFCEGSVSAFFVSDNVSVRGANASTTIFGSNEKQCAKYCAENRDNRGRTLLCGSALYESDTRQCKLYRKASAPDDELKRFAENGRRYYEKFCLADDVPADCAFTHFARVDDHILKGYAQTTTTVPTLADCMAYCMHEREFECKSAMYFYEEGECITNAETATAAPSDFQRPEDDDKVVFIQNGCLRPDTAQNVSPFAIEDQKDTDETTAIGVSEHPPTSQTPSSAQPINVVDPSTITTSSSSTSPPPLTPTTTPTAQSPVISFMTLMNRENIVHQNNNDGVNAEEKGQKLEENGAQIAAELKAFEEAQRQLGNISPIGIGPPARLHPKHLNEESTRQYGAKTIERAPDGSLQEKDDSHTTAAAVSSENLPTNANISTSGIRVLNRKGPESTKRLQLKLIKDTQKPRPPPTEAFPTGASSPATVPFASSSTLSPATTVTVTVASATEPFDDASREGRFAGSEGYFSLWGPWTPCTMPGERRVRRRRCLDLRRCKGSLMQVDYCPRDIPAVEDELQLSAEVQQAPILAQQQPIQIAQLQPQQQQQQTLALSHAAAGPAQQQPVEVPKRTPVSIDLGTGNVLGGNEAGGGGGEGGGGFGVVVPQPPGVQPAAETVPQQPKTHSEPLPVGAPATRPTEQQQQQQQQQPDIIDTIWSPWNGTCQHFASSQPCREGKVIGFEARECIAKDPLICKGPFFRYCTLPC